MQSAGDSSTGGEALPREARLTDAEDIRRLLKRGKRRKTRYFEVFSSESPVLHSRYGSVVPKLRIKMSGTGQRVRGAGVLRNRLKRRLREIGRRELLPRLAGRGLRVDILVRAKPDSYRASYGELRDELMGVGEEICSIGL